MVSISWHSGWLLRGTWAPRITRIAEFSLRVIKVNTVNNFREFENTCKPFREKRERGKKGALALFAHLWHPA